MTKDCFRAETIRTKAAEVMKSAKQSSDFPMGDHGAGAMVAPTMSFRATLTHAALVVLTALASCEIGEVNITDGHVDQDTTVGQDDGLPVDTSSGSGGTTGMGDSTNAVSDASSAASDTADASSTTGATDTTSASESTTGQTNTCPDPLPQGVGENTSPAEGYTISGCFDDVGYFGCSTCADWCEAGAFGDCVGGLAWDNCVDLNPQGYIIGCEQTLEAETAWQCGCKI